MRDTGVVAEFDLGIEAARQHSLVTQDDFVRDADVVQAEARQSCQVAVSLGVEPGGNYVNDADGAAIARLGLEQLFFARTHSPIGKLRLHHLKAFLDLFRHGAGAIAAKHELDHVGRNGKLTAEAAYQVLAHDVSRKGFCRFVVQFV